MCRVCVARAHAMRQVCIARAFVMCVCVNGGVLQVMVACVWCHFVPKSVIILIVWWLIACMHCTCHRKSSFV